MATLTLKNVPEEIHERLKQSAKTNRRSLNNEAIHCLELYLPGQSPAELVGEVRKLRSKLRRQGVSPLTAKEIQAYKKIGRP